MLCGYVDYFLYVDKYTLFNPQKTTYLWISFSGTFIAFKKSISLSFYPFLSTHISHTSTQTYPQPIHAKVRSIDSPLERVHYQFSLLV